MLKQANLSFSVAAQSFGDDVTSIQFSTQDKNTAKLIFTIREGKQPLNLTDVEGFVDLVMGDKSIFEDNKATVTAPLDGKLEYTITADQIRHPGRARGELQLIKKDGQSLGGFRFNFTIKKALVDEYAGPVKEYYVQDLEAIKAEIRKTADSIKDLDVVRIDSKLNELEQRVEEGGAGVDEQARQEIEEVSAQLAGIKRDRHPIVSKMLAKPSIMAHRGLLGVYPENTVAGFYECVKRGVVFFETDFRKTVDNHWVCIHDATTARTTEQDITVANSTLEQLKALPQTKLKNASFYGNPTIPTIDEIFQFIKNTQAIVAINFDYGIAKGDIPLVIEKIYKYGIQNNVICQGPGWQEHDNTLCIGYEIAVNEESFKNAAKKGNVIAAYDYGYNANVEAVNNAMKLGSKYNVPILIYTVENYNNFKKLDVTGVHSMMVDYLWFRSEV